MITVVEIYYYKNYDCDYLLSRNLERICIETVQGGIMTKDLAICIHGEYVIE
jgi:hypothetical protein